MGAARVYGLDNSVETIEKTKFAWEQLTGCDGVEATFVVADCIETKTSSVLGKECSQFDYAISHYGTGRCETKDGQHLKLPCLPGLTGAL